jgi:hypothetical protein
MIYRQPDRVIEIRAEEPDRPYIRTTRVSDSQMTKEFNRLLNAGLIPKPVNFSREYVITGRKWAGGPVLWMQLIQCLKNEGHGYG